MGPERVLIVGLSTRAFAESASRAGYSCLSVDAFGDLDQKTRVENVGLVRDLGRPYTAAAAVAIARRLQAPSVAYVGNLENHPSAVGRLAKGRQLLGNSPATLLRVRNFADLAKVVRGAGGRVPRTLRPGETPSPGRKWLRKPMRGGGGNGVTEWTPGAPLKPGELVQERVDGVLASIAFAADGRRAQILGLSQGLFGDPAFGARGYRYCGSIHPFSADAALLAHLDDIAQATTRAFGLLGVNGIDFILRDGEAFVLELNPRYSASMELIERRGRLNIFETHAAACRGALGSPELSPPEVVGKGVLWARRSIVVGNTQGWLARDDVRDLPFPGDRIRRGHPICTVFARGPDKQTCYGRLVVAAAGVERELEGEVGGTHA
jgi:predicted ATP-grasp superfamily ATP-dependent carboligase